MKTEVIANEFLGEKYYKINHPSGLTVLVMPKPEQKSSYAVFGTNFGSVDTGFTVKGGEKCDVPEGTAHFLEHKLFESEELGAFERYAKTGANANAYTTFDKTCYLFSCTGNFDESLEILLDFVKHPYFTQQTVEKEQGIIGQEIMMYRDDPDWQVLLNMLKALYEKNPVRLDIAGSKESISKIDASVLYKCYDTFYNLSNMVLAVAGNVTPEQVVNVVDRVIKNEETVEIERSVTDEKDSIVTPYVEEDMHANIKKFYIGFKEKPEKKSALESSAIGIAVSLICGRITDFREELISEGLINSSFSGEHFYGRGFDVIMFGGEGNDPEKVKERLLERIRFLKQNGVDRDDFENVRRLKYGNFVRCLNDVDTLANSLVETFFENEGFFDIFDAYRNVTAEDVDNVIRTMFDEDKCALSVIK